MTINVNNTATVHNANGNHESKVSKPVICIETGHVYVSVTDAAYNIGVSVPSMSQCCNGTIRTIKGNHYCFLSKTSENIDALVIQIRALNERQAQLEADAEIGRAVRVAQEEKQKAAQEREAAMQKLKEKLERRQRMLERAEMEVARIQSLIDETKTKMEKLKEGENND